MAIIGEQIILRKRRSNGEPQPNRIRLDKLQAGDELIVEIVVDKKNDVRHWFHFPPEMLEKRQSISFRASNGEVYWLSGLHPKPMLESMARRLLPAPEPKRRGRKPTAAKPIKMTDPNWRKRKRGPKVMKVLIFAPDGYLMAICPATEQAARLTNIRSEAIAKLCKTKRSSFDTGLSFRHWWRKMQEVDITDFTLTVAQYDEMCKRKPSSEEIQE